MKETMVLVFRYESPLTSQVPQDTLFGPFVMPKPCICIRTVCQPVSLSVRTLSGFHASAFVNQRPGRAFVDSEAAFKSL